LKRAERRSRQLKLDAFGGTTTMKVGKRRVDVRRNASNDPCCSAEHGLQKTTWNAILHHYLPNLKFLYIE